MIIFLLSSVLLLYLAFPNYLSAFGFWPFAWVFAVPLFFALENQPLTKRMLVGAVFGLLFYAFLVSWLIPYSFIGYVLFVAVLTISPVLFCAFYRSPSSGNSKWDLLYVPSLWVASEYVRTILLNGFSWNLGYSQTFNIYGLQIANLFGSWGISFAIIIVNYCLYSLIKNFGNKKFYQAVVLSVVTLMLYYGILSVRIHSGIIGGRYPRIDVCAVQPNIDSREKQDPDFVPRHIAQQIALSQHCLAKKKPDLIIWPETAISSDFLQDRNLKQRMFKFIHSTQVPVLVGAALWKEDKNQNSAVLLEPSGRISIYHKRYLVPFSEYIPSGGIWPAVSKFFHLKSFDFVAGKEPKIFFLKSLNWPPKQTHYKFGAVICSEDTIGSFFREISKQGAIFGVVLLNDGWFKHHIALVMHGQNAIMHAVENRLPLVRVANTGWTSYIDRFGRVKSRKEPWFNTRAVVTYTLVSYPERTLYNRIGDLFAVLCCAFVIIWLIRNYYNRVKA